MRVILRAVRNGLRVTRTRRFGPGENGEHHDQHLVAAWETAAIGGVAELQPPTVGGGFSVARLAMLLEQPVLAGNNPPDKPVWHCSIHNHRDDPLLPDQQWAQIAVAFADGVGLAPAGDRASVRWVAVRRADDRASAPDDRIATFVGMPLRDQPAQEPFESRDLELGAALGAWSEAQTLFQLELLGPLDAPGMDPTWLLRVVGHVLQAELVLFYGPHVDVSAFRSTRPEDGLYVGGETDITPSRLTEMLDELAAVEEGDAMPNWLRPAPDY